MISAILNNKPTADLMIGGIFLPCLQYPLNHLCLSEHFYVKSLNFRSMRYPQKKGIIKTEANASGKSGHASVPLNNRYLGGLLNERIEKRNKDDRHCDHGYGNIKTAGTVTPTGITASSTEPVFAGNIMHYNGYYRMDEGHKEFIPHKVQDNDFYLFTLTAITREMSKFGSHEADVHIAAGLPLTWVNI